MVCPEVFNLDSGTVSLNEYAELLYETKALEIFEAEWYCPVNAIEVHTDPPDSERKVRDWQTLVDNYRESLGERGS